MVALLAIGARGLLGSLRAAGAAPARIAGSVRGTYLRFLGLTILNPATIVYFSALILGLGTVGGGAADALAFVAGAFLASLSWQTLLAAIGAFGHRRLPARAQEAFSIVGNLTIVVMAVGIAIGLVRAGG